MKPPETIETHLKPPETTLKPPDPTQKSPESSPDIMCTEPKNDLSTQTGPITAIT